MKRKYFSILLAAMTIAASANVYAAPSIGQIIPEAPKVVEGNLSNNQQLIVKDVDTGAYKDKKVAEVVTKVNDDNTKVNMNEILKDLKVDTTETIKTNTEKKINPSLYEPLTPFVDLVIKEDDKITYETNGAIKTTLTIEAAKDVKKKGENAKVAVRNIRRDANDTFKKMEKNDEISEDDLKDAEEKIQKITDKAIEKIDKAVENKTKEILTV